MQTKGLDVLQLQLLKKFTSFEVWTSGETVSGAVNAHTFRKSARRGPDGGDRPCGKTETETFPVPTLVTSPANGRRCTGQNIT